ncbi:hypothetical protein E1B28_005684 [Marasmius oreades]|uniref:N-acetyltransferase domain-containing protein n=1 Tax=Marasmius oreades TaxID=181124 RepID=A0A9P7UUI1_9AGAR|nr:uncharacterized protein E1B28_005684 [Marasmius oreades]KAG7094877.1 hypothetical protein E1B28_005684 [Marasmius oreades]
MGQPVQLRVTPTNSRDSSNNKVRIRVCRPSDQTKIQNLFKTCIVYGAGSPARIAVADGFQNPTTYGLCILLVISLGLIISGIPRNILVGGPMSIAILVYLAVLLHGRMELYVTFAYTSCKDDLAKLIDHYELKLSDSVPNVYFTSGPRGFWVAEVDRPGASEPEIVGCIGLDLSRIHGPDTGEMRRMVVSPDHRGSGIASMLYDVCEAHARQHKLKSIVLTTTQFQPHGRKFYERQGYFVDSDKIMPSGLLKIKFLFYRKYMLYN